MTDRNDTQESDQNRDNERDAEQLIEEIRDSITDGSGENQIFDNFGELSDRLRRVDEMREELENMQRLQDDTRPVLSDLVENVKDIFDMDQEEDHQHYRDVEHEEDSVVVRLALPEFSSDQISVTAETQRLLVSGESTEEMYHDDFEEVVNLPVDVRHEDADVEYDNGFLVVEIPVLTEEENQTTIEVE